MRTLSSAVYFIKSYNTYNIADIKTFYTEYRRANHPCWERGIETGRENIMIPILSIMTMCGYAHIIFLSGFLSSNGVTALILLKFELFIPSSTWVTFRPTVGRLDKSWLVEKWGFNWQTLAVTMKTNLLDWFIQPQSFSFSQPTLNYTPIISRQSADCPSTDQTIIWLWVQYLGAFCI